MKHFLAYLALTFAVFGALVLFEQTKDAAAPLPVYGRVPAFRLVAEDQRSFDENALRGKVSIISFFFTSCQGPCPKLNAELAKVQRSFGGEPKLQLVSISIDPQHDTVDVLREYEKKLGANEETWHFLTGEEALIRELSRSGFKLGTGGGDVPGEDLFHSTKLTLVDSEGQIRGYYSSEDREAVEKLKSDASRLLSEITS
ncbi:MAG: SCO family protein [Bdellovibrionota bacterium]